MNRVRFLVARTAVALSVAVFSVAPRNVPAEAVTEARKPFTAAVSPMFGYDRDDLKVRGRGGVVTTETDTAPEYGVFAMAATPRWVATDFLFFCDVNQADVSGNLAWLNYYADPEAVITWNAGVGHLYHHIKPANEDIKVEVPMLKTGPLFRLPALGLSLNPYVGYAWERVDTQHGDIDNDSYLFGLTASWRWRMLSATVNYYYQDSQEVRQNFDTLRVRMNAYFSEHWGAVIRYDYMEHLTTDDSSVLAGPVYMF